MRNIFHVTTGFLFISVTCLAYQNNPGSASCNGGPFLQPPDGYVYIERSELANLNSQPLDLLANARLEFGKKNNILAAQFIHSAAQAMRTEASANIKGSRILETAGNLESLSQRVAKNEVKSAAALDSELTQAAHDQAEHHYLHANQAWTHHMASNVGLDLAASSSAIRRSAEWSGKELSEARTRALSASEDLSKKIYASGTWSSAEVDKRLDSLGAEFHFPAIKL